MTINTKKLLLRSSLIVAALGLAIFLFITIRVPLSKTHHEVLLNLPPQSSIENYLKIDAKPIKIIQNKDIVFNVRLESYQNPDILDLDKIDMALLEDSAGNMVKPTVWKELKHDDYSQEGLLVFPLPSESPKTVRLIIFELVERSFKWTLPPHNG